MSRSGQRWLALAAAALVAAVVLLTWPRSRPSRSASERAAAGSSEADRSDARARRGGVARRETTVAGHGRVRGQVVDEDGAPVGEGQLVLWCLGADDAVERIADGVVSLDSEGRFEGPGCRGRVCPELHHPFRIPAEPWSVRPGEEPVLEAHRLPRLWGRVVDPRGAPVAGAQVVVVPPPEADDDPTALLPTVSARTSSDEDGEFSLALIESPPCDPCRQARSGCRDQPLPVLDRVRLTARAVGWAPGELVVDLDERGSDDDPVEVAVRIAEAAITGTLVDAAGEILPRAVVLARSEQRSSEQHRAEIFDGGFVFDALGTGSYTVRVIQDGREHLRRAGVAPGATLELQLEQVARDVELEVVDPDGRRWPGVSVQGGPFEQERTDPDGIMRAQRVLPGTYILRVRPPLGRVRARELVVSDASAGSLGARNPLPLRIEVER